MKFLNGKIFTLICLIALFKLRNIDAIEKDTSAASVSSDELESFEKPFDSQNDVFLLNKRILGHFNSFIQNQNKLLKNRFKKRHPGYKAQAGGRSSKNRYDFSSNKSSTSLPPLSGLSILKLNRQRTKYNFTTNKERRVAESITTLTSLTSDAPSKEISKSNCELSSFKAKKLKKLLDYDLESHSKLLFKLESINISQQGVANPNEENFSGFNTLRHKVDQEENNNNNNNQNRSKNVKILSVHYKKTNETNDQDSNVQHQIQKICAKIDENNPNEIKKKILNDLIKADIEFDFDIREILFKGSFGQAYLISMNSKLNKKTSTMDTSVKQSTFVLKRVELPDWNEQSLINRIFVRNLTAANQAIMSTKEKLKDDNYIDACHLKAEREFVRIKSNERCRLKGLINNLKQHSIKNSSLIKIGEALLANDMKSFYVLADHVAIQHCSFEAKINLNKSNGTLIPEVMVKKWLNESVEAMTYLHGNNLLHANLKPSNFLVDENEVVKLTDFGFMNIIESNGWSQENCSTTVKDYIKNLLNKERNIAYLAKETCESLIYNSLSEIYSLGCIFYELLFLDKYHWSREDEILANELIGLKQRTLHDDTFAYLLTSMMSNWCDERPNATTIRRFHQFQSSLDNVELIKNGKFSRTFLSYTKSSNRNKCFKQIKLSKANHAIVKSTLANLFCSFDPTIQPKHKNLLFIDKYYFLNLKLFILTDYLTNGSLKTRLDEQITSNKSTSKLKESQIVQWMMQITSGLSYLHENHFFHGNLKEENILFTNENTIKLVDFGFYHLLHYDYNMAEFNNFNKSNMPPELLDATFSYDLRKFTHKSDFYMLGVVLYKCLTLNEFDLIEFNAKASNLVQNGLKRENSSLTNKSTWLTKQQNDLVNVKLYLLDFYEDTNEYSSSLKKNLIEMLDERPAFRPEAACLLDDWSKYEFGNFLDKFHINPSIVKQINSKCVSLIDAGHLTKQAKRGDFLMYNLTLNQPDAQPFLNVKSSFNAKTKIEWLLANVDGHENSEASFDSISILMTGISRHMCLIDCNYFISCDPESIYLIDDCLKVVKQMSLIETLEMKNLKETKPKTTSLNSYTLKLKIKAICYDFKCQKLYLLISVHSQQCLLVIFDLELSFIERTRKVNIKKKSTSPLNEHHDLLAPGQEMLKKASFKISSTQTFHMASISAKGNKSMCTTKHYLFVCEREMNVKAFSKTNAQYVLVLRASNSCLLPSLVEPMDKAYTYVNKCQNLNNRQCQDICVDLNENVYVAYSHYVESYNNKGEFKWRHYFSNNEEEEEEDEKGGEGGGGRTKRIDSSKQQVDGKIIGISINKNYELAIVTQLDDLDEFKCKFYLFSSLI